MALKVTVRHLELLAAIDRNEVTERRTRTGRTKYLWTWGVSSDATDLDVTGRIPALVKANLVVIVGGMVLLTDAGRVVLKEAKDRG